jgi:hypothetical protein
MSVAAPRYNNVGMVKVSGPCEVCPRHVEKWVPRSTVKRMKHMICDSYNCKAKLAAKLQREQKARKAEVAKK